MTRAIVWLLLEGGACFAVAGIIIAAHACAWVILFSVLQGTRATTLTEAR